MLLGGIVNNILSNRRGQTDKQTHTHTCMHTHSVMHTHLSCLSVHCHYGHVTLLYQREQIRRFLCSWRDLEYTCGTASTPLLLNHLLHWMHRTEPVCSCTGLDLSARHLWQLLFPHLAKVQVVMGGWLS